MYDMIVEELEEFRYNLRLEHIRYYFRTRRKRNSCIVWIILANPTTRKTVLELKLKVRNTYELNNELGELLTACQNFARGFLRSDSPEY